MILFYLTMTVRVKETNSNWNVKISNQRMFIPTWLFGRYATLGKFLAWYNTPGLGWLGPWIPERKSYLMRIVPTEKPGSFKLSSIWNVIDPTGWFPVKKTVIMLTKFATGIITLRSIFGSKHLLAQMFLSKSVASIFIIVSIQVEFTFLDSKNIFADRTNQESVWGLTVEQIFRALAVHFVFAFVQLEDVGVGVAVWISVWVGIPVWVCVDFGVWVIVVEERVLADDAKSGLLWHRFDSERSQHWTENFEIISLNGITNENILWDILEWFIGRVWECFTPRK